MHPNRLFAVALVMGLASPLLAQIPGTPSEKVLPKPSYSPCAGRNYPTRRTWTDTIGAPEIVAVWADSDFDPAERACYARVMEIPTPRWTRTARSGSAASSQRACG
jgi:hypothetical protein